MADPRMTGSNPHFQSRFVPRDEVLDAVLPPLAESGVWLSQGVESAELVTTVHGHGESLVLGRYPLPAATDPQKFMAACTYASRGSLMLAFALAGDADDDGNTASASPAPRSAPNARSASTDATTPDAGEYAALMASAKKNGTGAAVKAKLAEWKQPSPMTLEAYAKLTTDARGELESIAATK
jgi:hypothetical protein